MDYLNEIRADLELAEALDILCDFTIHDELGSLDEEYAYADVPFAIIGQDASGGEYGLIGEGDITKRPVGYVSSEGQAGKIATNLKEFFEFIVFCPFWHDLVLPCAEEDFDSIEADYKEDLNELDIDYDSTQDLITSRLKLKKDLNLLQKLENALTSEPKLNVYAKKDKYLYEDLADYLFNQ